LGQLPGKMVEQAEFTWHGAEGDLLSIPVAGMAGATFEVLWTGVL